MNFYIVSSLVLLTGALAKNLTLADVYGEAKPVKSMEPWHLRSSTRQMRSKDYFKIRNPEECIFPLEVVIIQDATASFDDNFAEMKDKQLPLMVNALRKTHPESSFGVVSFRDKPIWSLGQEKLDYCQHFELPLTSNETALYQTFDKLVSTAGGDPPENQFGAIFATAESQTPGWKNPDATRLIVVATDAPPHFEGDGFYKDSYKMKKFSGVFDEINADEQCLAEYYPTPGQVKNSIERREAYMAFMVFDGSYWENLPSESWKWFNNYIGQTSDFIEPLGENSTSFWDSLSKVIKEIEDIECIPQSTEEPFSSIRPSTTTPEITLWTGTSTTPNTDCPTCPPPPCHCQGHHHCHCAEVVIKLAQRPKKLRLEVEN